ncbi:MAG: hypothetical protein ABJF10_19860 [Chthoniobacter sp.]
MPSWKTCLQAIVLLSIGGFALVVVSGFWHVLTLLLIAAIAGFWLWCQWPVIKK